MAGLVNATFTKSDEEEIPKLNLRREDSTKTTQGVKAVDADDAKSGDPKIIRGVKEENRNDGTPGDPKISLGVEKEGRDDATPGDPKISRGVEEEDIDDVTPGDPNEKYDATPDGSNANYNVKDKKTPTFAEISEDLQNRRTRRSSSTSTIGDLKNFQNRRKPSNTSAGDIPNKIQNRRRSLNTSTNGDLPNNFQNRRKLSNISTTSDFPNNIQNRRISFLSSPSLIGDLPNNFENRRKSIISNMFERRNTMLPLDNESQPEMAKSEKKVMDDKGFSRSSHLGALYAVIVVLLGFLFPLTEALSGEWMRNQVIASFMTYLYAMSSLFIIYVLVHEAIIKRKHDKQQRIRAVAENFEQRIGKENCAQDTTDDASNNSSGSSTDDDSLEDSTTIDVYDYIAMQMGTGTMAKGTSLFLKGGIVLFAIANMIYVGLRIASEYEVRRSCEDEDLVKIIHPHYVQLVFIVLQTFFLLKDYKYVLRIYRPLMRFGVMHLLATNLCVWLRFLMIEVVEHLLHLRQHEAALQNATDPAHTNCTLTETVITKAAPFLFPFILEYSLVAMGSTAFLMACINIRPSQELYQAVCKVLQKRQSYSVSVDDPGLHHHESQFHKSHIGLYLGVIVFAACIVSMVLFFHWNSTEEPTRAKLCYAISSQSLYLILLIGVIIAMVKTRKFFYDASQSNFLDHALLMTSFAFSLILNLITAYTSSVHMVLFEHENYENHNIIVYSLIASILGILQCIFQTSFIMDGMQRVAASEADMKNKRGRAVITYLIVTNLAVWVFKSFQEKDSFHHTEQEILGDVAWTIIGSIGLPLNLFYHFHSSICLAHMWHHCYENPDENVIHKEMLLQ